jgi:hypothetical protein
VNLVVRLAVAKEQNLVARSVAQTADLMDYKLAARKVGCSAVLLADLSDERLAGTTAGE